MNGSKERILAGDISSKKAIRISLLGRFGYVTEVLADTKSPDILLR
jgi:hypothetical protein